MKPTSPPALHHVQVPGEAWVGSQGGHCWEWGDCHWHRGFNTRGCCERGKKTHLEYEVEVKQIISKEEFNGSNLLQDKLEKFEEKDFNVYVELTNGKVFGCDFVVFAT